MKTSSLMMCALVALTACGTGVKQSVRTPVEMGERIELKTPDPKMGLTINEALAARSSSRDFSPEMLSLEELSGVLWAAAGVNREDGHLTAPSAMALYPIRVYAFLPEGVYRYDSKANVLNRVIEGDRRELTAMQDFAYTAPLNLVYVADYSVYADRNQPVDRIRFWCAADAGGYTENVNLYAAGNGLKAITRGSFKEEALLEGYVGIGSLDWVAFNTGKKPFDDVRVRQAAAYAIDRNFFAKVIMMGLVTPSATPITPFSPFYTKDVNMYDVNLEKAKKLLDEAGYPVKADGTRFTVTVDYAPGSPTTKMMAEYLKPQLAKVGIDAKIRISPDFGTWAERVSNYNFDITTDNVFNWGDPVIGVHRTYSSANIVKGVPFSNRSEERRVGKECRSRWSPYH